MSDAVSRSEAGRVFRTEYGRAVSVLVRVFGDIDIAEEAVQDAFTTAAYMAAAERTANAAERDFLLRGAAESRT